MFHAARLRRWGRADGCQTGGCESQKSVRMGVNRVSADRRRPRADGFGAGAVRDLSQILPGNRVGGGGLQVAASLVVCPTGKMRAQLGAGDNRARGVERHICPSRGRDRIRASSVAAGLSGNRASTEGRGVIGAGVADGYAWVAGENGGRVMRPGMYGWPGKTVPRRCVNGQECMDGGKETVPRRRGCVGASGKYKGPLRGLTAR